MLVGRIWYWINIQSLIDAFFLIPYVLDIVLMLYREILSLSLMGVKSPFPDFECPGKLFEILAPFSSEQISDTRQTWYKVGTNFFLSPTFR